MKKIITSCFVLMMAFGGQTASAGLIGVDWQTGILYSVSEANGATTPIGNTGISLNGSGGTTAWADIGFAPNGVLYGFTASVANPTLYTINPNTALTTPVGSLGIPFAFEGALAFSSTGVAYGMDSGGNSNAGIFTINLNTGAATILGTVAGVTDVDGFAFRSDGKLVALDTYTSSFRVIDPVALTSTFLATVPGAIGGIGGVTIDHGVAYYVTAGPGYSGSDSLYKLDLFTGASTLVGNLGLTDDGLSGLTATPLVGTPEPGTLSMFALGLGLAFASGFGKFGKRNSIR